MDHDVYIYIHIYIAVPYWPPRLTRAARWTLGIQPLHKPRTPASARIFLKAWPVVLTLEKKLHKNCNSDDWTYRNVKKYPQFSQVIIVDIQLKIEKKLNHKELHFKRKKKDKKAMKVKIIYLGGFPSNRLLPSICICTFTRSVGLATNWPMAPASNPDTDAFLHVRVRAFFY